MKLDVIQDNYVIEYTTSDGQAYIKRSGIFGLPFLYIDNIPAIQICKSTVRELQEMQEIELYTICNMYMQAHNI